MTQRELMKHYTIKPFCSIHFHSSQIRTEWDLFPSLFPNATISALGNANQPPLDQAIAFLKNTRPLKLKKMVKL